MATTEKVVDLQNSNETPVDPNVIMPRHVQEAKERAEAFYAQPQQEQTPEQRAAAEEAARAAAQPVDPAPSEQQVQPQLEQQQPQPQPQPQHTDTPVPSKQELQEDTWAGRYNSMRGRYDRAMQQIGSLQEQLIQAGDEI